MKSPKVFMKMSIVLAVAAAMLAGLPLTVVSAASTNAGWEQPVSRAIEAQPSIPLFTQAPLPVDLGIGLVTLLFLVVAISPLFFGSSHGSVGTN